MVRKTSLTAFERLKDKLEPREFEYCKVLRRIGHPATDQEVCRKAGRFDPNYFRPRRKNLCDNGIIKEVGVRQCSVSKQTAHVWWFA